MQVLDQDSDDEAINLAASSPQNGYNGDENHSSNNEEENLVNILPTPLNGKFIFVRTISLTNVKLINLIRDARTCNQRTRNTTNQWRCAEY